MKKLNIMNLILLLFIGVSLEASEAKIKIGLNNCYPINYENTNISNLSITCMDKWNKPGFSKMGSLNTWEYSKNIDFLEGIPTGKITFDSINIRGGKKKSDSIFDPDMVFRDSTEYPPITILELSGINFIYPSCKLGITAIGMTIGDEEPIAGMADTIQVGNVIGDEEPIAGKVIPVSSRQRPIFVGGLKGGVYIASAPSEKQLIKDRNEFVAFRLSVYDVKPEYSGGVFLRVQTRRKIFFQTELDLSRTKVQYLLKGSSTTSISSETYYNLNLPVHAGMKFGIKQIKFRIQGGAILTKNIGGKSNINTFVTDYNQSFRNLNVGWQAGLGLDIWKITLDARYEADFGEYANHMQFFGKQVDFNKRGKQLKVSIGWNISESKKKPSSGILK